MQITTRSKAEARKVSQRRLLAPGWHPARIREAVERPSKAGNDMMEVVFVITDLDGNERELRDYFTDSQVSALKIQNLCEAIGGTALEHYQAGAISQDDFPGHDVSVRLGIEKRRGFTDRNVPLDYRAASSRVVNLRDAG